MTESILCRTCKKPIPNGRESPTFPFCSKRCKMIDLGRWFTGDYRISEAIPHEELDTTTETASESE